MSEFAKDGSVTKLTLNTAGTPGSTEAPPAAQVSFEGKSGAQVAAVPGAQRNKNPLESYAEGRNVKEVTITTDTGFGKGEKKYTFKVDRR